MQVTKVTAGFQNQTAERKLFTDEELQRELDKITAKNRQSFSPYLARIMP